jgi:hypothetical protein
MSWSEDDVGPGWSSIVRPLIERAEKEGVHIRQIKEKFGELRFYVGACSDDFYKAIGEATEASRTTCETCGKPGMTIYCGGFLKTACPEHQS